MKNRSLLALSLLLAAPALSAAVQAFDVTLDQNPVTREVTVSYTLAEDAIVTLDIQVGGKSIGVDRIRTVYGDVNRLVTGDDSGTKYIHWRPDYDGYGEVSQMKAVIRTWSVEDPPDWITASITTANSVNYYEHEAQIPLGITNDLYKTRSLVLRRIHACGKTWNMGAPSCEPYYNKDGARENIHEVTLTNDFYMSVYELTQGQYYHLMGSRPSTQAYGGTDADWQWLTYPLAKYSLDSMRGVSTTGSAYCWPTAGHAVDPASFLGLLRGRTGLSGLDLPVCAQWEFAARAGCQLAFYNGYNMKATSVAGSDDTDAHLDEIAWYPGNAGGTTHPVGGKLPNAFGLYDMCGNVAEVCLDWFELLQYNKPGYDPNIGTPAASGYADTIRSRRGGCAVNYKAHQCRVDYHDACGVGGDYFIGYRLCWTLRK